MTARHWLKQVSADFNTGADWTGGVVPGSKDDAILDASGATNYTVSTSTAETVNSIQTAATATLSIGNSTTFDAIAGTGSGGNAGVIVVTNNSAFETGGTIANSGKIEVESSGNTTTFELAVSTTLTGTGSVVLGDNANNQIIAAAGGVTLTNAANTISGAGSIGGGGLTLVNEASGVVNATGGNALVIDTGSNVLTNSGLLEASGLGGLSIVSTTVNGSSGGTILANSGRAVNLTSANIVGGTLATKGSGVIETTDRGTLFNGASSAVDVTGTVQVSNNTSLNIQGTIANTGKISLTSVGNYTSLAVTAANATITGGTVVLSNNSQNYITGTVTGALNAQVVSTLTNEGVIQGAGQIGGSLSLDNTGSIEANGTNSLVIQTGSLVPGANVPGSNVVTNTGRLMSVNLNKSTSEGGLLLYDITVANKGGTILSTGLATNVDLYNATIVGGALQSANGGVIETAGGNFGSVLDGSTAAGQVTLSAGELAIVNNTALTLRGVIGNQGTIALQSGGNGTDLVISPINATINNGSVALSDNSQNFIVGTVTGAVHHQTVSTLTNNSTISGSGTIGSNLEIINHRTIDATNKVNALVVTAGNSGIAGSNVVINTSLMESTNTNKQTSEGGLVLSGLTIKNSGTIEASGLFTGVALFNATIVGGTLATSKTGVIDTGGGNFGSVLVGVTNSADFNIVNNSAVTLQGDIVNKASLNLESAGNGTDIYIAAQNATLSGGGTVKMSANSQNYIAGSTSASTLTNVDNTIIGAGEITGLALVNEASGDIQASVATLEINTAVPVLNAGTIEAGSETTGPAGTLVIQSSKIDGSGTETEGAPGGQIIANDASTVYLNTAWIYGGTLNVNGTGLIDTGDGGTVLDGTVATVNNQGVINIQNNTGLTLQGAFDNANTVEMESGGNFTFIAVDTTNATLTGAGEITLSDNSQNYIYGATSSSTLVNVDNTITGAGQVGGAGSSLAGLTFVNETAGVVQGVSGSGNNALVINTGAGLVTNDGLIEAGDGVGDTGSVLIQDSKVNSSAGGVLTANDGCVFNLQSAVLIGGTLTTNGLGSFATVDAWTIFDGQTSAVNNQGLVNIRNNTNLWLQGAIDNSGTLALLSGGNGTELIIDSTNATLSGGGTVSMTNNPNNYIVGATTGTTLTNVDNTIIGSGQIGNGGMVLINEKAGVIDGNSGAGLVINTSATITNAGLIEAETGGVTVIDGSVNNTGTIEANGGDMVVNATLTGAGAAVITAGTLEFAQSHVSQKVSFTTGDGTLRLDNSQTYTGVVVGFTTTTGTVLDLRDIGFTGSTTTTATFTANKSNPTGGGVLTVTNGAQTAKITLSGNFTDSTFTTANDGSGGTAVTDPPKTTASQPVQVFSAHAASLGAPAAPSHAAAAEHQHSVATMLLAPRFAAHA